MQMRGTTAIVTGAASGIGRALTQRLGQAGAARLILLDLDRQGLMETTRLAGDAAVVRHAVNIADAPALNAIFAGLAADNVEPDFLFNNAGIPAGTPAWPDTGLERIRAILDTNLLGVAYAMRLVLPLMRRKGGSILNTASTSGLRPYLTGAIYAASKAGVIMLTQSSRELATTHGVRVNAICPGMVHTPFLEKTGIGGKIADWLVARIESGAILSPDDVAQAAIDLACDESAAGECRVLEAKQGAIPVTPDQPL